VPPNFPRPPRSPGSMDRVSMTVPIERVETRILSIRGHRVMLDADLAVLYGGILEITDCDFKQVNIVIIRAFVRMREAMSSDRELDKRLRLLPY